MALPAVTRLSYDDYLALERESDVRHEFFDGEAWAMAGGTPRHSRLKTVLARHVDVGLDHSPCRPYDSDLKVRVVSTGLATYPDLTVVCGDLERDAVDRNAVTNPTLLVEVLSDSTERWDRGGKFMHYRQIPSLQHYLLVSLHQPILELYTRNPDETWTLRVRTAGETLRIDDLGIALDVDALYRDLPIDPPDEPADPASDAPG